MTAPAGGGAFRQHLLYGAQRIVESFSAALGPELAEIYVLSFRIWRTDYDPRRPYVAIGYNTESQYRRELERQREPDPGETRWSYAFWLLEGFDMLGNVPEDPTGSALYVAEVKRLGLWYDDDGDRTDETDTGLSEEDRDTKGDLLDRHFADACIELARDLHASGRIEAVLGRPVPVVVFDMDWPGWDVKATLSANPAPLVADYRAYFEAAGEL